MSSSVTPQPAASGNPGISRQSVSNLFETMSPVAYTLMARPGNNLGNPTLIFSIPMSDFYATSIIANDPADGEVAQRQINSAHAFALGQFMLKGLTNAARQANLADERVADAEFAHVLDKMTPQPYTAMQPLVVNIRSAGTRGTNLSYERFPETGPTIAAKVMLGQRDLLYVVDGQHRRMGIENVIKFLEHVRRSHEYPKGKGGSLYPYGDAREVSAGESAVWERVYEVSRTVCTVAAEAHLGLNIEQERQLFHDLNNKTKKVEVSLALDFDSSNPVNQYVKTDLIESDVIRLALRGDKVDWSSADTGTMTRKELVAVNAHLFLNKSNINGAQRADVEERKAVAGRFWEAVTQCDGFGEANARNVTVLAQPVMLKALAKLTFDFAFGRAKGRSEENLNQLLDGLTDFDFSHANPVWRYYEMSEADRQAAGISGLSDYLPTASGNRDIGAFDTATSVMRFGAKHNDIFPILGDMIRFSLKLPSRHAEAVTAG